MHHFSYRNGILHAEKVSLPQLAEEIGTPFYCYATATFRRHYRLFAEALGGTDSLVCYAMKANANLAVLRLLAREGAGMDVVSEGELRRARAVGVPGERIVFSGVGKSEREMALGLKMNILSFNVESEPELVQLSRVAQELGRTAPVTLRVNPDVDAGTHEKIATGRRADKFGIPWEDAQRLAAKTAELPGLALTGLAMHIGSQITALDPFLAAFTRLAELVRTLRSEGHTISHVDLGGGLGIPYHETETPPHPEAYVRMVRDLFRGLDVRLIIEPGRLIAGNAGILVTRVLYVKEAGGKRFTIVDAAMNDLIRPTLYRAHHDIWPVTEKLKSAPYQITDVVGPVCESGDFLARDRALPPFAAGDLLAVMSAGAYGAVLSSSYNSRPLVPEVLVDGDRHALIRRRQSYDDMLAQDSIPCWLA